MPPSRGGLINLMYEVLGSFTVHPWPTCFTATELLAVDAATDARNPVIKLNAERTAATVNAGSGRKETSGKVL